MQKTPPLPWVSAKLIRVLDLDQVPGHLSAASGLVFRDGVFYVVADDELVLGVFPLDAAIPGRTISLVSGTLPTDSKQRKKQKPDWEVLVQLPRPWSGDGLLAIPSGSTSNRTQGVWIEFKEGVPSPRCSLDFSPIYQALQTEFTELNIEGAAFLKRSLFLLQRGNGKQGRNALIELDAKLVLDACESSGVIPAQALKRTMPVDLGLLEGVPLSFTDLTLDSSERLVFLAAAEDSKSTYLDGECVGSVIGCLDLSGVVSDLRRIDSQVKAEGIAFAGGRLYFVTDADDRNQAGQLFEVQ